MKEQPYSEPELRRLIDDLIEGDITPDEHDRLALLLKSDADALAYYTEYLNMHAALSWEHVPLPSMSAADLAACSSEELDCAVRESGDSFPSQDKEKQVFRRQSRGGRWRWYVSAAVITATVAIAAVGLFVIINARLERRGIEGGVAGTEDREKPIAAPDERELAALSAVAVLTRVADAEWEDSGSPRRTGSPLTPGVVTLKSGLAQIEFYSGATVILEGPASLELVSEMRGVFHSGKLRARVPLQAHGFTIGTQSADVVDLGTEFGLQVGDDGQAEIHVIEGQIELRRTEEATDSPENTLPTTLDAGHGVRIGPNLEPTSIDVKPDSFVNSDELARLADRQSSRRYQRWLESSRRWYEDPDTVAYYAFESEAPWLRTLVDRGPKPAGSCDGAIVGCQWAQGRWPDKKALEFKRTGDRVRVKLPGEFKSLSLTAWVRIEALEHRFNSLLLTDGFDKGEVHWQLTETGQLELSVRLVKANSNMKGAPRRSWYRSPSLFTAADLGRWAHLATVFDRDTQTVTHYLDGMPISTEETVAHPPLRIGSAQIGNWNPQQLMDPNRPETWIRSLNGRVDEFLVMGRALTGPEIRDAYRNGTPE